MGIETHIGIKDTRASFITNAIDNNDADILNCIAIKPPIARKPEIADMILIFFPYIFPIASATEVEPGVAHPAEGEDLDARHPLLSSERPGASCVSHEAN